MEMIVPGATKLLGAGMLLAAFTTPPTLISGASGLGTPSAAVRTAAAAAVASRYHQPGRIRCAARFVGLQRCRCKRRRRQLKTLYTSSTQDKEKRTELPSGKLSIQSPALIAALL